MIPLLIMGIQTGSDIDTELGERMIRRAEFKRMFGVTSDVTLLTWERTITGFPQRRRIGPNTVGWLLSEVLEYLRSCPAVGRVPIEAIEAQASNDISD